MTDKMYENAHKVGFLCELFPEHKVAQIIDLLQMPAIDINCALWSAIDLKIIEAPDKKTGNIKFLGEPATGWNFGDTQRDLQTTILYAFETLAKEETDLEETYLSNYLSGYSTQDTMIAVKRLIADKKLVEYAIEDGENTYQFFTLYQNREQLWGQKQFRKNPLDEKK
jgi:hypothetical protein